MRGCTQDNAPFPINPDSAAKKGGVSSIKEIMMNIKNWFATALACSAITLTACGGQDAQPPASALKQGTAAEGKTYRVALNATFAPFESMDGNGKIEGFDIDLVNAMAKAGNFKVEFKHQAWESLFPMLNNGDADFLASAVTITEERRQSMDFSDPYYKITQVILVNKGKEAGIKSAADLKKFSKVSVVTGTTGDLATSRILGADNKAVARFENIILATEELANGGVEAVVSDSAVVANFMKKNPDKNFAIVQVPDFEEENYGFVVRKGDTATQSLLNDSLKKVRESGEYDKIAAKYFAQ